MNIAIIPARGGSRRIHRKNIKSFCGQPIIGYAIQAAISSGVFDDVIVSTDDLEIAEVARSFGAGIPFMRPPELADDMCPTVPVIAHALDAYVFATGKSVEAACCIYPTAVFVTSQMLQAAAERLQPDIAYTMPVVPFPSAIQRAIKLDGDGRIDMFDRSKMQVRTQDLEPAYYDPGQFYFGRADAWREKVGIFGSQTVAVVVSAHIVQDIDNEEDWHAAEAKYRALMSS